MPETKVWTVGKGGDGGDSTASSYTLRYAVTEAQKQPDKNHVINFGVNIAEITLSPADKDGYILINTDIDITIDGLRVNGGDPNDLRGRGTKIKRDPNSAESRLFRIEKGNVRLNELILEGGDAGQNSVGGAIEILALKGGKPTLTISGCTFRNNRGGVNSNAAQPYQEQYGSGGAIRIFNNINSDGGDDDDPWPIVNVVNSAFIENSLPEYGRNGGAVEADRNYDRDGMPRVTFTNCLFSGNKAPSLGGYGGGAAANMGADMTFIGCTFTGNEGYRAGAVYSGRRARTAFVNCTFSGNESTGDGSGAIGVIEFRGRGGMTNCTVVGNKSARCGTVAVDKNGGDLTLANNIIVGNVTGNPLRGEGSDLGVQAFDPAELNLEEGKVPGRVISKGFNLIGSFENRGPREVRWLEQDIVSPAFSEGTQNDNHDSFFCWLDVDQTRKNTWAAAGSSSEAVDFTKDNHGPVTGAMYDTAMSGLKTIGVSNGSLNGYTNEKVTPYAFERIPKDNPCLPSIDARGVLRAQGAGGEIGAVEMLYDGNTIVNPTLKIDGGEMDWNTLTVGAGNTVNNLIETMKSASLFVQSPNGVLGDIATYMRWASAGDLPKLITVDEKGVVTGIKNNAAYPSASNALNTVWGYWNGSEPEKRYWIFQRTFGIEVSNTSDAGVSLSSPSLSLKVAEEAFLTAAASPSGSPASVTWSSSDPAVAFVDMNGRVKALRAGSATITAAANATGAAAGCPVTVTRRPAESITVFTLPSYKEEEKIAVEEEEDSAVLLAEILPDEAEQKAAWTIDDTSVASLSGTAGLTAFLTGIETGAAQLTVNAGGFPDVKREIAIEVTEPPTVPVTGVTLSPRPLTLRIGETRRIAAAVAPLKARQEVTWQSSDPGIAEVGGTTGEVRGVSAGTAVITATTVGLTSGGNSLTETCAVAVEAYSEGAAVEAVTLDKDAISLSVGEKCTLAAAVRPENAANKGVSWRSGRAAVASVHHRTGEVTARSEGLAEITVTTDDGGFKAVCAVTVSGDTPSREGGFEEISEDDPPNITDTRQQGGSSGGGCDAGAGFAALLLLGAAVPAGRRGRRSR
jgi:uncharacterized protein YjdB